MKCFNVVKRGKFIFYWSATLIGGTLDGHGPTSWAAIANLCNMMEEAEVDEREAHSPRLGDDLSNRGSG